jgi:general secretion pathway protein N
MPFGLRLRRATPVGSGFMESTLAELAWERTRKAVLRWGWAGLLCGALLGVLLFAPAAWLAEVVAGATGQRLLLADARGSVWSGSAVAVLGGGAGSRSAAMLPGRIEWTLRPHGLALALRLRQPCCIRSEVTLLLRPGLGRTQVELLGGTGTLGEWPAAWLSGLGAPWNTLQLGGSLRLASSGFSAENVQGRWRFTGQAQLELDNVASSVSTLERLGSYRLHLQGNAGGDSAALVLSTVDGALLLSGSGQWNGAQMRFRGEARAAPGFESALDNLLNIIGRRQGALSVLSIG